MRTKQNNEHLYYVKPNNLELLILGIQYKVYNIYGIMPAVYHSPKEIKGQARYGQTIIY